MHPIGIALAFLVFWSLVAVGVFLVLSAGRRLRGRSGHRVGDVARVDTATGVAAALHLITVLVGGALVLAGVYATFVVLVGR